MTLRHRPRSPLAEIIRSQREEIRKYKWIESEKVGRDIGWERAETEWMRTHFPNWKRFCWDSAIDEALQDDDGLN